MVIWRILAERAGMVQQGLLVIGASGFSGRHVVAERAIASSGHVQAAGGRPPFKVQFAGEAVLYVQRA